MEVNALNSAIEQLGTCAEKRKRPFKLLIVDDEHWVRETFTQFCSLTEALNVETADSGSDAIEKLEGQSYDLITVDLIMPELSGLDVLMQARKVAPQTPLILITGNATERLVYEAGLMGATKVIYKPVDLEFFFSEMTSVLCKGQ